MKNCSKIIHNTIFIVAYMRAKSDKNDVKIVFTIADDESVSDDDEENNKRDNDLPPPPPPLPLSSGGHVNTSFLKE